MGSRHKARIIAFQSVYSWEVNKLAKDELLTFEWMKDQDEVESQDDETLLFAKLVVAGVIENVSAIDEVIKKHIKNWDISRIAKVELAILRVSVYSLIHQKDIPFRVSIDEGINLAKEFGSDDSYKFINGVLDGISKSL